MHTISELLDAAKAGEGLTSDYKLALVFSTTSMSLISNYRNGRSAPDDAACIKLAAMARLDVGYVLACVHAHRAKSEETRQAWADVAAKFSCTPSGARRGPPALAPSLRKGATSTPPAPPRGPVLLHAA